MSSNQWSNKKTKHKTPAHQAKVDVDFQCCVGARYLGQVFGQGAGNQGPSHTDQKSCNFLCWPPWLVGILQTEAFSWEYPVRKLFPWNIMGFQTNFLVQWLMCCKICFTQYLTRYSINYKHFPLGTAVHCLWQEILYKLFFSLQASTLVGLATKTLVSFPRRWKRCLRRQWSIMRRIWWVVPINNIHGVMCREHGEFLLHRRFSCMMITFC